MGILKNPNDAKADIGDVAELIRRTNDKNVTVPYLAKKLDISESRAQEIANEACNNGKGFSTRVHRYGDGIRYGLRW